LIDESTILAIIGDYDEAESARAVLSQIAQNVVIEESTGFNPTGDQEAGSLSDVDGRVFSDGGVTTTTQSSHSEASDSRLSAKSIAAATPIPYSALTPEEIESSLAEIFPTLKPIDIRLALKAVSGDFDRAFDELTNVAYLEETGQRQRGVDAFFQEHGQGYKKRKGKGSLASASGTLLSGLNYYCVVWGFWDELR